MKLKKTNLIYLTAVIITILLAFGLKSYSDVLRKESFKELQNYNRSIALQKIRLAQVIWFPLRFDNSYQRELTDLEKIEDRAALIIYLREDYSSPKEVLSKSDLDNFIKEIKSIRGVKDVKYISREEAWRIYQENNKDNPALLELVTPNILPQSIEVYLNDFSISNKIEEFVKSKPFVDQALRSF